MRSKGIAAALLVLWLTVSLAATDGPNVRRDTQIPVELQTRVNTETAKKGDSVILRTSQAVLIGQNVVIPLGAKVLGTIDRVSRDSSNSPRAVLVIRFHELQWSEGSADLNAVVSSVESTNQRERLIFRHIHNLFSQKTLLERINVYAHVQRDAFTEFTSDQPEFVLRPGIRLVLRQLDPDRDPAMMVSNLVLDVNQGWKK
jgi:hypothetical protein